MPGRRYDCVRETQPIVPSCSLVPLHGRRNGSFGRRRTRSETIHQVRERRSLATGPPSMKTRPDLPGIGDSDVFQEIRQETCARIGRLPLCAVFIATTFLAAAGCVVLIATSVGLSFGGRWPSIGFATIWAFVGLPIARRLSFYVFGRRHLVTVLSKRGRCTTCGFGPLEPGVSTCCECGAAIAQPET